MSEPIRVLQVFAALDSGGVSNHVMNLYREIDTNRIQFDFALTGGERTLFDDEVLSRGGRVFYCEKANNIKNLRRIMREDGPFHAVHSHLFFYSGIVLAEARRASIPIRIAHAHNAYTGESRSLPRFAYEYAMQMLIHSNATNMLGCSDKACRYVFGDKMLQDPRTMIMPDGIDCDRFRFNQRVRDDTRKKYGLDDKFVVGHVGHFNSAKNHEKILSVFQVICRHSDEAMLLLVGDGELEQIVRARVAELNLTDRVVFAGSHRNVECFYQAMDVFLFPSQYEGFGMAMIEAQVSGLACIASDVVPRETDANGRSIYLPLASDDTVWANAVLNAPKRTEVENSYEKVKRRFDIKDSIKKEEGFYLK